MSKEAAHTVIALASLASIGGGLWWVYPPAALVVLGVLLLSGVIYARTCPPMEGPPK